LYEEFKKLVFEKVGECMKLSIIIPVYNVEKYIFKCLESIKKQSFSNFEVIIVNDGSTDNSQNIINEFEKADNRFKSYIKTNGGLSDARNYGIKYASGDYLLFIDSDDYIEKDLFMKISERAEGYEMIKYKLNIVDEDGVLIRKEKGLDLDGEVNAVDLLKLEFFEPAWSYAYNLKFWRENNFKYEVGKIHEDFGLTPLCVAIAKRIYYLDYYGYNYVQRKGSIMNGSAKLKRRAYDILYHFDNLSKKIEKVDIDKDKRDIFISFLANGAISNASLLIGADLDGYILELKNRKIYNYIMNDTISRKIKKTLIKINIKLYVKLFLKRC